jgi:hypothetical protein
MQPRRHRMRKPARLDSARAWVRSAAQVTVGTYAKRSARFAGPDWVWVGDRRMFVVGHTAGGAPFGLWEDEVEDWP